MPATIESEPNNLYLLRVNGVLKRSELEASQGSLTSAIDAGVKPRLLVILENFEGWERGTDWNDLDFVLSHGNAITKIAIVGEAQWEPHALAFVGAGFRPAQVKFFSAAQLT